MFGQGTLVCLVGLQVLLVPFGGAIVAGAACLPVIDRHHALAPALQAGAGVGGPGPGVQGPLSSAVAQVAVRPPATCEVKVDQGTPNLLTHGLYHLDAHPYPLHVLVGHLLDLLLEHRAQGGWHEERGIMRAIQHGRGQELLLPLLLSLERARPVLRLNAEVRLLALQLVQSDSSLYNLVAEPFPVSRAHHLVGELTQDLCFEFLSLAASLGPPGSGTYIENITYTKKQFIYLFIYIYLNIYKEAIHLFIYSPFCHPNKHLIYCFNVMLYCIHEHVTSNRIQSHLCSN